MMEAPHYAWLLERLSEVLGPDVARGTLEGGLAHLKRSPATATDDDYRRLLRGPLRDRLRLNLGKREATVWVRRVEMERFPPKAPTIVEFEDTPDDEPDAARARRASDLPIILAGIHASVAIRALERLRAHSGVPRADLLASEHALELAEAEYRHLQRQELLQRLRVRHQECNAWHHKQIAHQRIRVLTLTLGDTGPGPHDAYHLRSELASAQDYASALDALELSDASGDPELPSVDLRAQGWLRWLERPRRVRIARQHLELAELHALAPAGLTSRPVPAAGRGLLDQARVAYDAAAATTRSEIQARLDKLQAIRARAQAAQEAHRRASVALRHLERAPTRDTDDLVIERARLDVLERQFAWVQETQRFEEATYDLCLLVDIHPDDAPRG